MKDSGIEWIGEIPEDWGAAALGKICSIQTGNTPSMQGNENYYDEGLLIWVKPDNLNKFIPIVDTKERINEIGYAKARIAKPNTPLICCIGSIGKFGYSQEEVAYNQQINAINFDENIIQWKYGLYYLSTQEEQHWYYSTGNVVQILNSQNQKNIIIPTPPINEQQKIANFLDQKVSEIDHILEKTRESIEEYKKYKQSLITEAVTKGLNPDVEMKDSGIEWIGEIPKHWEVKKIKYIFKILKRISGQLGYDVLSITQQGLKVKDIISNDGQLSSDYSKYQFVYKGDFAMNHMDLLTGWIDLSEYDGVTSPDYRVFRMKQGVNYSKEYYKNIFQICYTNRIFYGLGQGVSNLGRWRLQTEPFINFYLPVPTFEEQKEIANFIHRKCTEIDSLISQKEALLSDLETYKKSLIYECVTGKRAVD
ncbi:restriction endonuclease subunit S [Proteocatella sphenisci]|uniref:restriction endonuclease subunit S n=1 Tax=Proteocatella sphenisci TaxID=181070 RepID=UPI0004B49CEC|nr:restriction endonuclease subunit S [Proteocatella sphenisci]